MTHLVGVMIAICIGSNTRHHGLTCLYLNLSVFSCFISQLCIFCLHIGKSHQISTTSDKQWLVDLLVTVGSLEHRLLL